ncbi:hypothetical protein AB4587_05185 [Vibrio breoganii]
MQLTKLSNLNACIEYSEILDRCLEDEVALYLFVSGSMTAWAVSNKLHEVLQHYADKLKQLSEFSIGVSGPKLNREERSIAWHPSLVGESNLLVKLTPSNIERLKVTGSCELTQVCELFTLDDGELNCLGTIWASELTFKQFELIDFMERYDLRDPPKFSSRTSFSARFLEYALKSDIEIEFEKKWVFAGGLVQVPVEVSCQEFEFVFCKHNITSISKASDIWEHVSSISVTHEELFLTEQDASQLKIATEYIPDDSVYHLPISCQNSGVINEIAKLGYRIFEQKDLEKPEVLSEFLKNELGLNKRESNMASLIINPKSKGKMYKDYRDQVQLKVLVDFYFENVERIQRALDSHRNNKSLRELIDEAIEHLHYSDENRVIIVKWIEPWFLPSPSQKLQN